MKKENITAEITYGLQLCKENRVDDAVKLFLNILSEYPDSLETRYNIALLYMQTNDYPAAIQHLLHITKIINTAPKSFQADVWSFLGICYSQIQSFPNAIVAFQKAAKMNPSLRSREIFCLKKCIQEKSESISDLYHELGNCYLDMGNDFHAEKMYMKALEHDGDQTTIVEALAQVYERIHNMKKRIFPIYSEQSMQTDALPDQSIRWLQSTSYPLEDPEEIRKIGEPYFISGNRILEIQWHNKTNSDVDQIRETYDGILLLVRENSLSPLEVLDMLKRCIKWVNHKGKIVIIIENQNNSNIPLSSKTLMETILNTAGWTVKETNTLKDQHSIYIVAQRTSYEILWQSPLFNLSGYSEEQNHFLDGIRPYPLRVKVYPLDNVPSLDLYPSDMKMYLLSLQNQQIKSPLIHYQAAPANFFTHPVTPISIGRTMFETNSLPANWVDILNEMTEVWVPSEFNRETFASAGVKLDQIKIMPGTLDENKYDPQSVLPYPLTGTRIFKFLSVFDWSIRKGWDILLQAYFEEFSEEDDVSLVMKISKINEPNTNPYNKIKELTKRLGLKKLPRYHIIQENLSQEEMIRLYAAVDCFVLPSRGEGWGRPYMEAMAMELATIGTKWSGQQAFMDETNSFLLNIEGLVSVDPNGMPVHFHGHQWAEPSVEHLKTLMRHVYNHPAEAKQKGLKARSDLFPKFSRHTIGQQIYQRMDELVKYYYN